MTEKQEILQFFNERKENYKYCENTELGWRKLGDDFEKEQIKIGDDNSLVIVTYCANDDNAYDKTFLSLQYFFIIADRIRRKYPGIRLGLCVYCAAENMRDTHTCYRVKDYLLAMRMCYPDLYFIFYPFTNEEKLLEEGTAFEFDASQGVYAEKNPHNKRIGKLFPLIRICEESGEGNIGVPYGALMGRDQHASELVKMMLEEPGRISEFLKIERAESMLELLRKFVADQFSWMWENAPLGKRKNAEECYLQMFGFVGHRMAQMSLLGQILWSNMLHFLLEVSENSFFTNEGDMLCFREETIMKTYQNALVYASGIEELLENSCLYSEQHAGYLSFVMHSVKLKGGNVSVFNNARKREILYRRYRENNSDQVILGDLEYMLEITVLDDAYNPERHVPVGVMQTSGAENYTVQQLFEGSNGKNHEAVDKCLHHYGIPLFRRSVILNKGRFRFRSPGKDGKFDSYFSEGTKQVAKEIEDELPRCTLYQVLLPLKYTDDENTVDWRGDCYFANLQEFSDAMKEMSVENIPYMKFFEESGIEGYTQDKTLTQEVKIDIVKNKVQPKIKALFQKKRKNLTIFAIDINDGNGNKLELFTKALLGALAEGKNRCVYCVLNFLHENLMKEFVRYIAVLYDRFGNVSWMKNVQIALCETSQDIPSIKMVLAGENITSLRVTANSCAYYDSTEPLQLLDELHGVLCDDGKYIKVEYFPYDLFLSGTFGSLNCNMNKSWFLEKMKHILESDLQEKEIGCKIKDAHIRIGSKMHVRDFYEAELLFNNVSYVYRFAYLLAWKICLNKIEQSKVILIGYEMYSSILLKYLRDILQKWKAEKDVKQIIYIKNKKGTEEIIVDPDMQKEDFEEAIYIIILPIATTLTTVYKIKNVLKRQLNQKGFLSEGTELKFMQHYTIVLVDAKKDFKETRKKYWKEASTIECCVELEKEKRSTDGTDYVHYFMKTETDWYDPTECPMCQTRYSNPTAQRRALVDVNKTSTLPAAIFPLYSNKRMGISFSITDEKSNMKFIERLKGCVTYGHIKSENNHFQFYIRFSRYYSRCCKELGEQLKAWFDEQKKSVEKQALNIVVSPLGNTTPSFLCDVLDNIFGNDIRLFYIQINTILKEDVRARFSYLAKDFAQLYKRNQNLKINIYYVDNSIVTGQTLVRGQKLVRMLLEEAGIDLRQHNGLYKKVFVLLNRSSYDTAATFVEKPIEDYRAVATLAIPSFNTLEGSCPTCELVKKYKRVAKCSASNDMYWYYMWLAQKQEKRSLNEYNDWKLKNLASNPQYFQELMLWIISNKSRYGELINKLKSLISNQVSEKMSYETVTEIVKDLTLREICNGKDKSLCVKCTNILEKDIFAEKTYRRLELTHQSMYALEKLEGWDRENIRMELCKQLKEYIDSGSRAKKLWDLCIFVKVWSQGYVARIAPVKSAVLEFLEDMILLMLNPEEKDKKNFWDIQGYEKLTDSLKHLLDISTAEPAEVIWIYQLYWNMAKNLCGLQSILFLDIEIVNLLDQFWNCMEAALKDIYNKLDWEKEGEFLLIAFLDLKQMQIDFTRYLKWLVMAGEEDSKAHLLQSLCEKMSEVKQNE